MYFSIWSTMNRSSLSDKLIDNCPCFALSLSCFSSAMHRLCSDSLKSLSCFNSLRKLSFFSCNATISFSEALLSVTIVTIVASCAPEVTWPRARRSDSKCSIRLSLSLTSVCIRLRSRSNASALRCHSFLSDSAFVKKVQRAFFRSLRGMPTWRTGCTAEVCRGWTTVCNPLIFHVCDCLSQYRISAFKLSVSLFQVAIRRGESMKWPVLFVLCEADVHRSVRDCHSVDSLCRRGSHGYRAIIRQYHLPLYVCIVAILPKICKI